MTIYVCRNEAGEIYTYGATPDGAAASVEVFEGTMAEYSARLRLTLAGSTTGFCTILADGVDSAVVEVSTSLPLPAVGLLVDGAPVDVVLTGGVTEIEISAEAPGLIEVRPADLSVFPMAGQGLVIIEAVKP